MRQLKDLNIGVLMGGMSSEREISLKSGKAVTQALESSGLKVQPIDLHSESADQIKTQIQSNAIDVAFIALHGYMGEDGFIQRILEELHIPFTGSSAEVSHVTINKIRTQAFLRERNIPVPKSVTVHRENQFDNDGVFSELNDFPWVVKSPCEGSSIGVFFVENTSSYEQARDLILKSQKEVHVEKFISGREMTIGILGNKALPIIEVRNTGKNFFDYDAKYVESSAIYDVPANLDSDKTQELQLLAQRVFTLLGCHDLARIDLMLDKDLNPFVLEVNTIPGFTSVSLLPKAAQAIGMSFENLCIQLIELAHAKKKEEKIKSVIH